MSSIETHGSVNPPSTAMRSYLSTHMLWACGHFARLARAIEANWSGRSTFDIHQRAYSVAAVLSAVGFAEAAINEFFQDVADDHSGYPEFLEQQAQSAIKA